MYNRIICKIPEVNTETHTGRVPWKHWLLFYLTAAHTWTREKVWKLHSGGWLEDCKAKRDWVHSLVNAGWKNKWHGKRLHPLRQPFRLLLQKGSVFGPQKTTMCSHNQGLTITDLQLIKSSVLKPLCFSFTYFIADLLDLNWHSSVTFIDSRSSFKSLSVSLFAWCG